MSCSKQKTKTIATEMLLKALLDISIVCCWFFLYKFTFFLACPIGNAEKASKTAKNQIAIYLPLSADVSRSKKAQNSKVQNTMQWALQLIFNLIALRQAKKRSKNKNKYKKKTKVKIFSKFCNWVKCTKIAGHSSASNKRPI